MSSRQPVSEASGLGASAAAAAAQNEIADRPVRERIGGRYEVVEELGRGGMACVYRVIDVSSGRALALKQLLASVDAKRARETTVLFEREFHTLAQLSHPRVIEVYDYGVTEAGPYYTMELLDGGDLRERTPVAWREACELIYDVCSSLALLHSRRLVHRDVSPRNVRCTRDGHAKLIDFGAMVPMGINAQRVGTAPFVAPEVVHGSALDARTDLFSLGNSLYYAVTGRLAYPARDFAQLLESWQSKPLPLSAFVPDVPPQLDRLVASLISLEAALRPRSAFEVMQRLAAVANIQRKEALSVSKAYLVTPSLVGRDEQLATFHKYMERAHLGRGRALAIMAAPGLGRTRMLDAWVLDAKLLGACVLRVGSTGAERTDLGAVRILARQLLEALPDAALAAARAAGVFEALFDETPIPDVAAGVPANDVGPSLKSFERAPAERPPLQRAVLNWFTQLGKQQPLLIAVDGAERLDDGSLAWLAALAERVRRYAIVVAVSIERKPGENLPPGLDVLASRCTAVELPALTLPEIESLFGSVFGDVPNLALLGARIHAVAAGNPRQSIELAQLLVDRGTIGYDGGAWSLPERLSAADLPASAEDAFRARASALGPLARHLLEAQALATDAGFTREEYALLVAAADAKHVDQALDELVALGLVNSDGRNYSLAQRSAIEKLCAELAPEALAERHRSLAELYARSERPVVATARHLLLAGDARRALDRLLPFLGGLKDRIEFVRDAGVPLEEIGRTLELAHAALSSVPARHPREEHDLRKWMTSISVVTSESVYWSGAPQWLAQLVHDSGLEDWRKSTAISDAGQRLVAALTAAGQRFAATPETERIYPPDEAIRQLVHYVAVSIAIGARTFDNKLLLSLPELLEPFAPLSPLLAAIWQNALATRESSCFRQGERARARWVECYESLGKIATGDAPLLESIRYAIAFGVGSGDATLGLASAMDWAEILDRDVLQKVNAMYLRKIVRLSQGDLEGAERCRKQAELLALQSSSPQMFTNLLAVELMVHAAAWDLTGVKQIRARLQTLADRHKSWLPFVHLAEAHYQRLRGDLDAASQACLQCLELATPDPNEPTRPIGAWLPASSMFVELSIASGRHEAAKAFAEKTLAQAEKREMGAASNDLVRALALAEAKLGHFDVAARRLDALIERQRALSVVGVALGASYEARARIAIWADDRPAVERYGKLTATQFRHGLGSPLGARYERLMDEARSAGVVVLPPLSPFESTIFGSTEFGTQASAHALISRTMDGAVDGSVRATRALSILCESRGARAGHLFLATGDRLLLAASTNASAPDDLLTHLVSDFWIQERDDIDVDTAVVSEDSEEASDLQIWTDRKGVSYRPILVSGTLRGQSVNAGLALLVVAERDPVPVTSMQLVAELARFLVRTGDSHPEPSADD